MAFKGNSKQAELWTEKPQVPQGVSWHHQKGNFSLSWASYAWRGFNKIGKLNIQMTDIWRNNENYQETLTRIFKNKDIMQTPKTNDFLPMREGSRKEGVNGDPYFLSPSELQCLPPWSSYNPCPPCFSSLHCKIPSPPIPRTQELILTPPWTSLKSFKNLPLGVLSQGVKLPSCFPPSTVWRGNRS